MAPKKLLFSLTAKDFEIQTFCTGGNGGQHRNAKRNGVRIIHHESGARAEHRDGRDQGSNRSQAFLKLIETKEFKAWHKLETAKRLGLLKDIDAKVDAELLPDKLRIESFNGSTWEKYE